ncbi:MAG: hypothetical protein K0S79_1670 [Nitrospira sp.]|nr:hypothetical protein [Nitrospira sp.]
MAQQERMKESRGRDARGVVSENLDSVESGVDVAIDSAKDAVHEFRDKAEEVADAVLGRVNKSWERQRPRIEAYMTSHPWIVFGGLILLAYLFSAKERTR